MEAIVTGISGGTGEKLTKATIIVAGTMSLVASLISMVSIWLQSKNYRKPLLQRYVIRILLMVPIYSLSSWVSILSLTAAMFVDPVRDVYEAFTIYTFVQLLINFLGGERALIIMMHGREPVHHLWPLNHCLAKVDISDPHTFLAIKRGILQYAWLKPVLSLATIGMKSAGVYKEGELSADSGYLWTGIMYNVSVTLSLYSLGLFWVCMSKDLQPFRPVPKFLCIKLIIFASYWQGFFLSILVWLGAIPDNVGGYTSDNLAAAIQDALICIEMPIFAVGHWYAFSWHDYADATISAARMPIRFALRDAFGVRDLVEDTKETFTGNKYEYRLFDSGDNVLAHEESSSRVARMMEGMRYERGGKGKYWIPKPGEASAKTPLLGGYDGSGNSSRPRSKSPMPSVDNYGTDGLDDHAIDPEEEKLYERARRLEFGDWNYPVITAHEARRHEWATTDPELVTTSTNRNLLQPTKASKQHRRREVQDTVEEVRKKTQKKHHSSAKNHDDSSSGSKSRSSSSKGKGKEKANGEEGGAPKLIGLLRHHSSSNSSVKSDRSQLVDLVVEDKTAEERERVRARKEGSAGWNELEPKRFVRTYGDGTGEDMRSGYEPNENPVVVDPKTEDSRHENNLPALERTESQEEGQFTVGDDDDATPANEDSEESKHWKEERKHEVSLKPKYGLDGEDLQNVWKGGEPHSPPRENP